MSHYTTHGSGTNCKQWRTLRLMKKMLQLLYLQFYRKGGDGAILKTVMRHDQLTILRIDTSFREIIYPYMHLISLHILTLF